MHYICCSLFAVLFCVGVGSQAHAQSAKKRSTEYHAWVPRDAPYLKPDPLPVVVLLPQNGKRADTSENSAWAKQAEKSGFLVVAPPVASDWAEDLADLEREHPVDKRRVFVVGEAPPSPLFSPAGTVSASDKSTPAQLWSKWERTPRPGSLQNTRLTVVVAGLRGRRGGGSKQSAGGQVLVALYDSAKGYPDGTPRASAIATVTQGDAETTFDNLPPGDYAVSILHDANKNNKMDMTFGFPIEGFGASNGAATRFASPQWNAARFYIAGDSPTRRVVARVVYPTGGL